ncbi:putative Insecticidal toxin complex protein TccB2, partial [Serendipita sp. 398]
MEQRFPTASFSAKIQRDDGVFGGHGKSISQILDSHPEFDLRKGNIELLFKGIKEKKVSASDNPEVKETMKALQRVFKLTPNFRQTEALFRKNVRSCAAISGMGRSRFLAAFASLPDHPFTPEEGTSVFHRAENINIATMMLAGNIHSASSALQLKAFSNPLPPAKLEAISKDFPNLKSLFQFGDACACDDCMTVHGAAAYLVDVLLFLDQRWVIDTTKSGGDISTIGARTALFSRRPDLGDLDLNCANTNNALPYIDVVCELLEDAVAPDGGFSVPSAVPVDTGLVSPALLQLLEGQGLPFTNKATVSDQDKSTNSRVVRDSSVVVKLTPSGSGQWIGRVLKQTYQTADKLAAMPEYVNIDAYDRLRTAPYAFSLPFDLDHMETRAYFAQYSISRAQLMRVMAASGSPSAIDITVEELGLTDEERQLIITEDPNNQDRYWNTGNPSDPVSNLVKVDAFITRASIKYSDLQKMLSLGLTKRASWLNPSNVMYIHHEDSSCDLSKKDIAKLDKTGLDRLHRFIRLWKKISAPGWDIALIDRAISISTLGGGDLGDSLLQGVADIRRLRDKIGGGISLTECVALYDHFVLDGTDAVYANVFLNVSANGPIDQDFQPANVETNPLGKKVNKYVDYLSVCFGRSADDVKLLLSSLPDHGDDLLSANSLSTLYQRHTLARWLNLPVEDLLSLKILTGLQDLKDPSSTLSLLDALASVRSSNLSLSDLLYFLAHRASPADLDSKDLHDEVATSILTRLQVAYIQAREDNSSPFDKNATSEENTSSATALASKLPGFKATDSGKLVLIFSNKWADTSNTASSFIDEAFGSLLDTTQIQAALAALETAPPSETESRILDLIQVIDATISTYLYNVAKQTDLLSAIEDAFSVKGDVAQAILRHAQVAGAQDRTPQAILTDESLVGQPALPPPLLTPSEFDPQYRALRLLNMVFSFIQKMGLSTDEIPWILRNSRLLQWLAIDGLKYQDDIPIASFNGWIQLQTAVKLSGKLPLVIDPLNHSMPLSIYGLFSLTLVSSTTLDRALKYLSQLAGWEITSVTDLSERFGLTIGALKDPLTIIRLQDAVAALRTIHLDLNSALQVIKPKLSSSETSIMRQALKSLYDDPTWLGIIKNIMDPLRLLKRDALVAFLLAVNPSMKDTDDLYDYFLIDVEMGSQMATSRIVQAHATVQLFVQRCLMGLEPSSIADQKKDASWKQWTWMSQFRLWEANRKVFLWPENWIEPELRDDKSEIFITLENTLQQNQINADTVQDATVVYLESLNDIAQLQVLATYYQLDTYIMHIFARTKGGDPPVFYYRQLLQERSWTPWQKIDVDIKGEHIVAFDRNGRLSLAWLEINLESDPNVAVKVPNPNSIPAAGLPATPPKQRWKIQLAVSERDLAGKWRPKKLSQGAVFYPPAGNYVTATTLPMDDRFHLFTLTLGDNQAMTIARDGIMFGAFSLEGCKGYPEPISYVSRVLLRFLPAFRNCEMDPQVFVKQSLTAKSDYAMASLFNLGNFETILGLTQGIFRTAYPMQMSLIDWAFVFLELYLMTRGNATRSAEFVMRSALTVPLGTFMPFFHNDFARTWAVIPNFHPGRRPSVIDDLLNGEEKTFSDIYPLVILTFTLLRRYLLIWEKDHDFNKLKELLVADPDYQKFVTEIKKLVGLQRGYHFYNLYHPLMCFLLSTVNSGGIPALMDRETQLKDTGFNFQKTYAPVFGLVSADYPTEDFEFRPIDGYASYNWELFFHLPFEIAVRLSQQQKFEEAQNWFHYVFNPLGTTESGDKPQRYWNTKPFFTRSVSEYQEQLIDQILYSISSDPNADHIDNLKDAVTLWRQNPFSPYTVARSRTVALQTTLVLHYIKNLLDWGDSLFRQFTRESVTAATQLYILADKLLGPKPRQVPPAVPTPPNTFNELESKLDIFGNALLTLENLVPDLGTLPHHGDELPSPTSGVTFSSLYFAIPQNENMLLYWDTVADRLYKIRNSQNIDGVFTPLALFAPPIDPGAIIRALASGVSLASVIQGLSAPLPLYRFWFVTQKASELTLLAASLGNALLSALEKQDAEELARLRSDQEIVVLNGLRAVKVSAIAEGKDSIKALERSLLVAQERLNYYSSRPYMNAWEIASTVLSGASLAIDVGVLLSYLLSGGLKAIPDFQAGAAGFGCSPTALLVIGGQSLGGSAETITKSVESAGKILDKSAAMTSQQASFQRRQDDWEFNATLAQLDIETINAQIDTAKTKLDGLLKDLDAHDLRIHAEQASNSFMKSKYTSKELYNWMIGQISSTYFTAYNLAYDMAKRAERSFMFELADTSGDSFIGYGYWDSLRSGLLAAETLGKDIKKLESAYMDRNKREFELAKNISLAELDPFALISLRATGQCLVQIPEEAYDLDYPGHYVRRIKTVSISIPCIVGPLVPVSATLSLTSNRYRRTTDLS